MQELSPSILEILRVSGAAGASVGVLDGETNELHFTSFGHRDVAAGLPPNEHTVYHLASLSKSFTAAAVALLVADGKLSFGDRMCDILPGFHHADDAINNQSTLLDFLSHRTGLASKNALWQQDGPELLLSENDTLPMVSYLDVVHPLGEQWTYNNFGYDILANVIAHASGSSWGEFVTSRIIQPLGLRETTTAARPPSEENWARGYMPAPDGTLTDVGRPEIAEGTVQQAANGVKSSVSDLVVYYKAVLDAWRSETSGADHNYGSSPLKNVKELLTPHIPLDRDAEGQWYAWLKDCGEKNDYVALAQESAAAYDDMWTQLPKDIRKAKARWPDLDVATYVFRFGTDEKGNIQTLRWEHDPDVPGGETFVKKANDTAEEGARTEL
ncbi:beta-lactamase/transpeptidase-like protein, partial [Apiosordaria backusii]